MRLFLRNTTHQSFEINCTIPEMRKTYSVTLHPKRDQEVRGLNIDQIHVLIAHLEKHGARDRKTLHGKTDDYHGLAYSLDKPFTDDEVLVGYEAVLDHAQDRSVQEATRAAVSATVKQTGELQAVTSQVEMMQERKSKRGKAQMSIEADRRMNPNESTRLAV